MEQIPGEYREIRPLVNKIFDFILQLQQAAVQLRVNHWQTTSFAEHKATDGFVDMILKYSDEIAETTMGDFSRPRIETTHLTIGDNSITSTKWTLDMLATYTKEMMEEIRISDNGGILSLLAEFDAELKKVIYLLTLE